MLLLDNPTQGVEPLKFDMPWDASREECDNFINVGTCRSGAAELALGKCCNAFCPLGILRPLSGNRLRALRSGSSSPCSGACIASIPPRRSKIFLPQPTLIAPIGLCCSRVTTPAESLCSSAVVGGDGVAASAADAVDTAYTARVPSSSLCNEPFYYSAQYLCSQKAPAAASAASATTSLTTSTVPSTSRNQWSAPPSTGRLLMVDWTPPASLSSRSECTEDFFSPAPARKKCRKEEMMACVPVSLYSSHVCNQQTSSRAAAGRDRPECHDAVTARTSHAPGGFQSNNKTCAVLHKGEQPSLSDAESRTAHLSASEFAKSDSNCPRVTRILSKTSLLSPSLESSQPLHTNVVHRGDLNTSPASNCILDKYKTPFGTTSLAGVASSSRKDLPVVVQQLHGTTTTCKTSAYMCGLSSVPALLVDPSQPSVIGSKQNKYKQVPLYDKPGVKKLPSCGITSATVAIPSSCVNASNLSACLVSESIKAGLPRGLHKSTTEKVKNAQGELAQDILNLQSQHLPDVRFPFAAQPAVVRRRNDEPRLVKTVTPTTCTADTETLSTEKDVNAFLSLLLWPYNIAPYQFHPALLKAVYTEWTKLYRKAPVQQQQLLLQQQQQHQHQQKLPVRGDPQR